MVTSITVNEVWFNFEAEVLSRFPSQLFSLFLFFQLLSNLSIFVLQQFFYIFLLLLAELTSKPRGKKYKLEFLKTRPKNGRTKQFKFLDSKSVFFNHSTFRTKKDIYICIKCFMIFLDKNKWLVVFKKKVSDSDPPSLQYVSQRYTFFCKLSFTLVYVICTGKSLCLNNHVKDSLKLSFFTEGSVQLQHA